MALIPFSVVLSMEGPQEGVEFHSWNKYISLPKWIAYLIIYKLQTAAALSHTGRKCSSPSLVISWLDILGLGSSAPKPAPCPFSVYIKTTQKAARISLSFRIIHRQGPVHPSPETQFSLKMYALYPTMYF